MAATEFEVSPWYERGSAPYGQITSRDKIRFVTTKATRVIPGAVDSWSGKKLPDMTLPVAIFKVWQFEGSRKMVLERPWATCMEPYRANTWSAIMKVIRARVREIEGK